MTKRKSRSQIGNHDRLGLRSNGMFVMFQRKKIKQSVHIDCSQSMHTCMERKLKGNELRKAITWQWGELTMKIYRLLHGSEWQCCSQSAIYSQFWSQSAFYTQSAVCNLQSAVCILYWPYFFTLHTLTVRLILHYIPNSKHSKTENFKRHRP